MLYCDEVGEAKGPTVSGAAAAKVAGLQSIADKVVDGYRLRKGEEHRDSVETMRTDSWRWQRSEGETVEGVKCVVQPMREDCPTLAVLAAQVKALEAIVEMPEGAKRDALASEGLAELVRQKRGSRARVTRGLQPDEVEVGSVNVCRAAGASVGAVGQGEMEDLTAMAKDRREEVGFSFKVNAAEDGIEEAVTGQQKSGERAGKGVERMTWTEVQNMLVKNADGGTVRADNIP